MLKINTNEKGKTAPANLIRDYGSVYIHQTSTGTVKYIQSTYPKGNGWTIYNTSGGGGETLTQTLNLGNTTGGNDILISTASGDSIVFVNADQTKSISLFANPVAGNFTQIFQDKSGTIALTSDITATLYNGNGTVGAGRVATLTDFIAFNGGEFRTENGYWQGAAKILYINPNGTANNTFVGEGSGNNSLTGVHNTAIGYNSLTNNTTGSYNIAIGNSLANNTGGSANIALGFLTLGNNTTGGDNVGIGHWCLGSNTTGTGNVAIGRNSLNSSTVGTNNIAIGSYSLTQSTTSDNTAIGVNTLPNQTTGARNTAIGTSSGYSTTTGSENIYIGYFAGQYNTVGSQNIAIGRQALRQGTSINQNVAIGHAALYETLGDNNVGIGSFSGFYETGSNKLFIDNAQRANEADGRAKALIYGIFDASVANQRLNINASVGIGGGVANATSVLNIANLPVSSVGLVSGDVWNNGGILTIV